jgi:hypothetical protein
VLHLVAIVTAHIQSLPFLTKVDDGSAVIAVHHIFKQPSATPLSKVKARPSRTGKERQLDDVVGGIPSEYLLPPPPPLPSSSQTLHGKGKKVNKVPINVADVFGIGALVSLAGRVDLWIDRRERVVFVDSVLPGRSRSVLDEVEHEGYIHSVDDANEEPKHLLRALHLAATEYSKVYQLPSLTTQGRLGWVPINLRGKAASNSRPFEAAPKDDLSKGVCIVKEPRRSLRVMEDVSEVTNNGAARMRALGMTRRLVQERKCTRDESNKVRGETDRDQPGKEIIDPSSSLLSNSSNATSSAPRQRQLRHYTKLSDTKMTDSTFRVYVEKHIIDHCSGDAAGQSFLDATPRASKRGRAQVGRSPPAFTLSYLTQVAELRGHAERTVEVATKRREDKKRRKAGLTSAATIVASTERSCDKMKRLYASVMQAMLMDGIVVLASPKTKLQPPFNGKRQRQDEGLSSDTDTGQGYRRVPMQEDAYQVVTPALLLDGIIDILSRCTNTSKNLTSAQVVQKMQATDERWRFLRSESVQEGMQLLLPSHTV